MAPLVGREPWSKCPGVADPSSSWIEPGEEGQLGRAFFDETAELPVEDCSVLRTNVSLEAGLIEVLLEDKSGGSPTSSVQPLCGGSAPLLCAQGSRERVLGHVQLSLLF